MSNSNNNNSVTDNSLLILQFNANGLKNHAFELETVLNNKRIDIALITETHFTKYSYIHIPGYTLIKTTQITPSMGELLNLLNPHLLFILNQTFVKIFFNPVLSVLM